MDQDATQIKVTPKDFFLWASAMVTLYGSVVALITLLFQYIEYTFPDPLMARSGYYDYYDGYSSGIRFAIASLIVLAPTFLILMRLIRRDIEATPAKQGLWVRRWALYFTLFVAGATIAGDLITLVNYFLDGDLTTRFLLKVVAILVIAGGFFLHFLADLRGYWLEFPGKARLVSYGAALVVLATVLSGFFIIGSPFAARLVRFDNQKTNDLMSLQYEIVSFWQQKEALPQSLSELTDPISGFTAMKDPQTGDNYGYRVTGQMSFELCATFNVASKGTDPSFADASIAHHVGGETWEHGAGQTCFEKTIDPDRYPVFEKGMPVGQ